MIARRVVLAMVLFMVAGCATPVSHYTPSGKPEVTISTNDFNAVKSTIVAQMLNKGYSITKDTDFQLVFEAEADSMMSTVLFGSEYDTTPVARISFSFAPIDDSVRVVADAAMITNAGSAFERRTDMNNSNSSARIQEMLDDVKRQLELSGGEAAE